METNDAALLHDAVRRLELMEKRWEHRMEVHNLEEWLTGADVMEILKISERTLQTLRDRKILHPTRLGNGKLYFYSRRELEALLENGYQRSISNL